MRKSIYILALGFLMTIGISSSYACDGSKSACGTKTCKKTTAHVTKHKTHALTASASSCADPACPKSACSTSKSAHKASAKNCADPSCTGGPCTSSKHKAKTTVAKTTVKSNENKS